MVNNINSDKNHCEGSQWILAIVFLWVLTLPALAAVPDNINYQGYLTNSGGSPVNGTVNVSFSLYNVNTGGIALWSGTQSVQVTGGLFNVKLGGSANPFPIGLFDAPLWLGVNVAGDGEMSPRAALSSSAFANKADDADTVGGMSAGSLDQSAHVSNTDNPHNVTAAQIGAVTSANFSLHTNDPNAHHNKTTSFSELTDQASDAQIPAAIARDSELSAHAANASAHHARYSNAEAVSAMGTKADNNPLHHDKRTDAQIMATVIVQDGAGSALDADLVDGLHASEIIDAAQDEVRIPISSLPFTISSPGSYYVTGNLDGSSGGIDITTDNVTLDLMGFTLDGGGVADYGINFTSISNVTIKNGTVRNFGNAGIIQINSSVRYAKIIDVNVLGNGTLGTTVLHAGINLGGTFNRVEHCTAGDNGGGGIYADSNSKLINNTAYGNTHNFGIYGYHASIISGNVAYGNSATFAIIGGNSAILTGNIAYGNTVVSAIFGGNGAVLSGNSAYNNTATYGINGGAGANINNNTAYNNSGWGIRGDADNIIRDNTIYNNNSSNTPGLGGLVVVTNSRVIGNTVTNNSQNNIYVSAYSNALIDNHVADSSNGIYFTPNFSNYYRNNTASQNATDYAGAVPTGSGDGGGNVSF